MWRQYIMFTLKSNLSRDFHPTYISQFSLTSPRSLLKENKTVTSQQLPRRTHFPRIYLRDQRVPQIYGSLDLR